jgi:hypothetical protein
MEEVGGALAQCQHVGTAQHGPVQVGCMCRAMGVGREMGSRRGKGGPLTCAYLGTEERTAGAGGRRLACHAALPRLSGALRSSSHPAAHVLLARPFLLARPPTCLTSENSCLSSIAALHRDELQPRGPWAGAPLH